MEMLIFYTKPFFKKNPFLTIRKYWGEYSVLLQSLYFYIWKKTLRGSTCCNAFLSEALLLWYSCSVIVTLHVKSVEDLMIHKSWSGMIRTERLIEPQLLLLWILGLLDFLFWTMGGRQIIKESDTISKQFPWAGQISWKCNLWDF